MVDEAFKHVVENPPHFIDEVYNKRGDVFLKPGCGPRRPTLNSHPPDFELRRSAVPLRKSMARFHPDSQHTSSSQPPVGVALPQPQSLVANLADEQRREAESSRWPCCPS
jgi:hypothetical protein